MKTITLFFRRQVSNPIPRQYLLWVIPTERWLASSKTDVELTLLICFNNIFIFLLHPIPLHCHQGCGDGKERYTCPFTIIILTRWQLEQYCCCAHLVPLILSLSCQSLTRVTWRTSCSMYTVNELRGILSRESLLIVQVR